MNNYPVAVVIGLAISCFVFLFVFLPWSIYHLPKIIQGFRDNRNFVPENERIHVKDIVASYGEWEVSEHSETTIKRGYSSKYGVYEMTIVARDDGSYFSYVYLGDKSIEDPNISAYEDLESAVVSTYKIVVRHYNLGGPVPKVFTDEVLNKANDFGKEKRDGD